MITTSFMAQVSGDGAEHLQVVSLGDPELRVVLLAMTELGERPLATAPYPCAIRQKRLVSYSSISICATLEAKKAKAGSRITWFLSGTSPATWGRIVDGTVEAYGKAIEASQRQKC